MKKSTIETVQRTRGRDTYTFGQGSVDLGHGNILAGIIGANLNKYVMTIWDRPTTTDAVTGKVDTKGGIDTIDASALATKTYIDLRAGHFSAIGTDIELTAEQKANGVSDAEQQANTNYNVGIAVGAEIENAKGGAVDDYIRGNDLANVLEGNGGNDTLQGGVGNDTLDGGSGNDTYTLEGQFTMATIKDNDGQGSITLDNNAISGASKQLLQGIYKDDGADKTYIKLSDGGLLVAGAGGQQNIYVEQWNSNNLGISLSGEVAAAPTATGQMKGNFKKKINDHGTPDTSDDDYETTGDAANNYMPDPDAQGGEPGALDLITGTAGNDVMDGGGGSDALFGLAGDDYIMGGTEGDVLQGGMGADTLMGGTGDDIIFGSSNPGLTAGAYRKGWATRIPTIISTLKSVASDAVYENSFERIAA